MTATEEETSAASAGQVDERALESGAAFQAVQPDPGPVDIRALAVAAATAAGAFAPGQGSPDDAVRACVVRDGITEKIEKLVINDGGAHGAGTTVEYTDGYYDEQGERIATATGSAVVVAMTPHMWQFHASTAEFADGSFAVSGFLDAAALMRSMTQILQIRGLTGRYAGKAGYMSLTVADPSQRPPHYATAFALC
ncbi:MAG TPA: hypothetical protein VH637_05790 [Streptosporangiaceae bacterium]|jgi:hypothetical protein